MLTYTMLTLAPNKLKKIAAFSNQGLRRLPVYEL